MTESELQVLKNKISFILKDITNLSQSEYQGLDITNMMRTPCEKELKPYYLIFLLLVSLLGYGYSGEEEKISFTIPIKYKGNIFLLQHRKLGMALLTFNGTPKANSLEVTKLINKAISKAKPFFDYYANGISQTNNLNVINNSNLFFNRLLFQLELYKQKVKERESFTEKFPSSTDDILDDFVSYFNQANVLQREQNWLAISVIEAFFSFSEHTFVHSAILQGQLLTKKDVAQLAVGEWKDKFTKCIDIEVPKNRAFYDKLIALKEQIRNHLTHGAFGKNNEAFQIHSPVGAIPMILSPATRMFSIGENLMFTDEDAISLIEGFIEYYWNSNNFIENIYIQSGLPTILTFALDNTYRDAMSSIESMEQFTNYLSNEFCNSVNMDW